MICLVPTFFGFLLPGFLLGWMAFENASETFNLKFLEYAQHSFILAGVASLLAAVLAVSLAYGQRLMGSPFVKTATRLSAMGYAIPGSVIVVGIALPFGWLDQGINHISLALTDTRVGLVFSGTVIALVYAYLVRFWPCPLAR